MIDILESLIASATETDHAEIMIMVIAIIDANTNDNLIKEI